MSKQMPRKTLLGLLLLLIVLHIISNIIWHNLNEFPQGRDTFEHLNKTANMIRLLRGDFEPYFYQYNHSYIHNLIFLSYHYPALYYYITAWFYFLFISLLGYKAIYISSSLAFILLVISVYKIGAFYASNSAGFLSAFICSLTPIIYFSSRQFNLEIAVTAMVALTYYLILKSNNYSQKKYAVYAGIAAGFSLLFKYTALVFIGAFILKSAWEFKEKLKNKDSQINLRQGLINFSLFLLSMSSICSIYYFNSSVIKTLSRHVAYSNYLWKIPQRLIYYLTGFFLDAQGLLISIAFLSLLFLFYKEKESRKIIIFLIGIPYFIISLVPKRPPITEIEFLMPAVPFAAVLIGMQLAKIKNMFKRRLAIMLIALCLLFQFFVNSFLPKTDLGFFQPFYNFSGSFWGYSKAPIKEYACKDVLEAITQDENRIINIGSIGQPESMNIFPAIFGSYVYLNKKPWKITYFSVNKQEFYAHIAEYDYLIYASKRTGDFLLTDNRLSLIKKEFVLLRVCDFKSTNRGASFQEYVSLYKKIKP